MKKLVVALLVPVIGFSQGEKGFTIKGQITGLKDSTLVYLVSGSNGNPVAQTYASKGSFSLFGKLDSDDIYQLSFIGYPEVYETYLTNDNVTVSGSASSIKSLNIAGSPAAQDYQVYLKR